MFIRSPRNAGFVVIIHQSAENGNGFVARNPYFLRFALDKVQLACYNNCARTRRKEEDRVTVKEIAKLAGTSRGTVDRVLHNRPGVAKEVQERVLQVIEEYNFKPNTLARALSRKQVPKTVGVILNSVGNPFFDDVLEGIDQCLADRSSYDITLELVQLKGYRSDEQVKAINDLVAKGIDGLVLTAMDHPAVTSRLKELTKKGMPIITVNIDLSDVTARTDYIGCDYLKSGRLAGGALELLSFGGPLTVGVVHGSRDVTGHNQRLQGFTEVTEALDGVTLAWQVACGDDDDLAYRQTMEQLKTNPPDVIYVVAGGVAGVLQALEETNSKTVAITNDMLPITREYLDKGVIKATVFQQPFEQGYNAVGRLIDCLYGLDDVDPALYKVWMRLITKYH